MTKYLPNYIDYIEGLIGDKVRKSNKNLISSLSLQQLNKIREGHHDGWRSFCQYVKSENNIEKLYHAPTPYKRRAAEKGEFRPMLHGRLNESAAAFGGDGSYTWEHGRNEDRFVALKRFLLFSHGIVLADPLWYINQFFGGAEENEFTARSRLALINFLDFLYSIKDLIRSDIVFFYPQYEHTGVGFESNYFRDVDFEDWYQDLYHGEQALIIELTYRRIIEQLFYCVRYGASYFVENPRLIPVLEKVLDYGYALGGSHLVTRRDTVTAENMDALRAIAQTSLPSLETLSLKDIVSVRKNSEGFNKFRALLKEGLLRIESGSLTDLGVTRQAVEHSLAEGRNACEREIRGSSLLSKVRQHGGSFAIGAMAGVLMGDPTGGLGTGTITACLSVLKEYIFGLKEQTAREALLRHYALWGSDT